MKQKIVLLLVGVFLLSGCAVVVNPTPVAGKHLTAQKKCAEKFNGSYQNFLGVIF